MRGYAIAMNARPANRRNFFEMSVHKYVVNGTCRSRPDLVEMNEPDPNPKVRKSGAVGTHVEVRGRIAEGRVCQLPVLAADRPVVRKATWLFAQSTSRAPTLFFLAGRSFFIFVSHCAERRAARKHALFASPRTDDRRRTNDSTCGPQAFGHGVGGWFTTNFIHSFIKAKTTTAK